MDFASPSKPTTKDESAPNTGEATAPHATGAGDTGAAKEYCAIGGGGDDAVCFTAGPRGAYFGAGVIHSYLAARRRHPVVAAGISSGAVSAAAMQRCYQELGQQQEGAPAGSVKEDDKARWSWFRRYITSLTDKPMSVVWDALPDLSDFFADMPPIRDTSLPPKGETEARRKRYILIKLGRRLASLPVSIRRVAEAVVYYIRSKEQYGGSVILHSLRCASRVGYLAWRLARFVCELSMDNFYKPPRPDGKEPPIWTARPLFGFRVYSVAFMFSTFFVSLLTVTVACTVIAGVKHSGAGMLRFFEMSLVAAAFLWIFMRGIQDIHIFAPEYEIRQRLQAVAKLLLPEVILTIIITSIVYHRADRALTGPFWTSTLATAATVRNWGSAVVALCGVGLAVTWRQLRQAYKVQESKHPDGSFLPWALGLVLDALNLRRELITGFYAQQKLKLLFDETAVNCDAFHKQISSDPMPVLLVSAPLQSLPTPAEYPVSAQQVWPSPGVPLVEAISAAIALPGLVQPVSPQPGSETAKLAEGQHSLTSQWVVGCKKPLDIVDGAVVRQNPLPALFKFLNTHRSIAEQLDSPDGSRKSIRVVFGVPLNETVTESGTREVPTNIIDVVTLSMQLARRRDTKQEIRQTNFVSRLESLVLRTGGETALRRGGGKTDVRLLDTFPIYADSIAPEKIIDLGAKLAPDRVQCLKVMASGCRQTMSSLYGGDPALWNPEETEQRCPRLLSRAWTMREEDIPDPPGTAEICAQCSKMVPRKVPDKPERPNVTSEGFARLTRATEDAAPRIIVVASGGVFRGAFQIGMIAALLKAKVKVDLVAGASVGTLMGSVLASAINQPEPWSTVTTLMQTFLNVDRDIALTATLKSALRELGLRSRSVALSPADLQKMVRRGSRFDPGYAVAGAPPALLDALSTLLALPLESTKRIAAEFVAGHVTDAFELLIDEVKAETLPRLGIERYLMGVSLLEETAVKLLFPTNRKNRFRPQPFLNANGDQGVAVFGNATNLLTRRSKLLGCPSEFNSCGSFDFIEAVLSSSAFPGVFQPRCETDIYPGFGDSEVFYADGGMFDNLPFFPAMDLLSSIQIDAFAKRTKPGDNEVSAAIDFLEKRHRRPDLFLAGSLNANPDTDPNEDGPFDTIVAIRKRASMLDANQKIRDFELAATRVHAQIERLRLDPLNPVLKTHTRFLNSIVDAAVLPIFPADRNHLNGTFSFCRTLGMEKRRIQTSVADGCYETLASIAKAQAVRPATADPNTPFEPEKQPVEKPEDLLSKTVWGLFRAGKLPFVQRRTKDEASDDEAVTNACPYFKLLMAAPQKRDVAHKFTCPFAELTVIDKGTQKEYEDGRNVYAACQKDEMHSKNLVRVDELNPPEPPEIPWEPPLAMPTHAGG